MSETVLQIKGMDDLLKALETAPEVAVPLATRAMMQSLAVVQDELATYPPDSEANRPGRFDENGEPLGYYERGRGWWYPLKRPIYGPFQKGQLGKRGGIVRLGKKKAVTLKVAGYKLRRTSERLGTKWTNRVQVFDQAIVGEVGTTVSYADAVQGASQAGYHAQRGWQTADQVLEAKAPEIIQFFQQAADDLVRQLAGGSA